MTQGEDGLRMTQLTILPEVILRRNLIQKVTLFTQYAGKTRRKHRQRPAAKLIGPNCNGIPWPIKLSKAMLKISIAQQQQQER